VPTLTIVAEHWADTARRFVEQHAPKSAFEVLGGHMMFWEHDEAFNRILERFVNGQNPTG